MNTTIENRCQGMMPQDMQQGEIILYQPDETVRLEVRLEDDTVWLTQAQISILFQRERSVISRHINNAFKEGECDQESNVHFLHIPNSDKPVKYYSLDVIISVGYRVKSLNGTKFRRWANDVLKQYMLKGYVASQRITNMEQTISQHTKDIAELRKQVDFFVRTSLPPVVGVFSGGQVFSARLFAEDLIKAAKHEVILIVDDDLWHCGASFKDLGRRLFAIDKMGLDKSVILNQL